MNFSKNTRKHLGKLAADAYERHLGMHLDKLFVQFQTWKNGEITAADLNLYIHEYHHGPSRHVWGIHSHLKGPDIVAQALARGLVEESEIPSEVRDHIRERAEQLKEIWNDKE